MVRNGSLGWRRAFVIVGLSLSATFVAMPATVAFAATEEAPVTAQASSEFPYSYADGLAGFLRYLGDGTSANMLGSDLPGVEGDAAKQYYSNALNNIGSTTSALNLDSVKEAIDILEECNILRRAAGLSELQVNTRLMALSAISATYAANYPKISDPHQVASDNGIGENLAWNYPPNGVSQAFDGWYDSEKKLFDEAVKDLYDEVVSPGKAYAFCGQKGPSPSRC